MSDTELMQAILERCNGFMQNGVAVFPLEGGKSVSLPYAYNSLITNLEDFPSIEKATIDRGNELLGELFRGEEIIRVKDKYVVCPCKTERPNIGLFCEYIARDYRIRFTPQCPDCGRRYVGSLKHIGFLSIPLSLNDLIATELPPLETILDKPA